MPATLATYLGVDLGTSSCKALLLSADGNVLATGSSAYPTSSPTPGALEQNPADWWQATVTAVRKCLEAHTGLIDVTAIGVAGHMSVMLPLDASGDPVRPAMTVADTRGSVEAKLVAEDARELIATQTGNSPMAAFTLPKYLWFRNNEPHHYAGTKTFVSAKDWLNWRLTGELETEPTDAGNTLLLSFGSRSWIPGFPERVGLRPDLLPDVTESLELRGTLTADAAHELGLTAGIPVSSGLADMAASIVGSGMLVPGRTAITLGTSGQITRVVDRPTRTLLGRMTYHPHAVPGRAYVMASIFTGGRALSWLGGVVGQVTGTNQPNETGIRRALALAASSVAGANGVTFSPYLTGGGSPTFDPELQASFQGLTASTTAADLARAVLEGVAFEIKLNLGLLEVAHGSSGEIVVAGGGFQSELWTSIVASVLDRPVRPLVRSDAGALGAAIAAGAAVSRAGGAPSSLQALVASCVHLGRRTMPHRVDTERYEEAYARFSARVAARSPVHHPLVPHRPPP